MTEVTRPSGDPWERHPWARADVAATRHGVLGTIAPSGWARLVPCVYALLGEQVVGAVDHKPKVTTRLARLADIERTGQATLLVEHYEEDWERLWWVRVSGPARVLPPGNHACDEVIAALAAKYEQYAERRPSGPCYTLAIEQVAAWRAAGR